MRILDSGGRKVKLFSMSGAAAKMRTELSNLSLNERAELAQFLIHSLDHGADADAAEAWENELARRAEEIETGRAFGEPAEKVFSELRAKHS